MDRPTRIVVLYNTDYDVEDSVPGIDAATFDKFAAGAKENCPVSKALKAVEITLKTKFV
jgi:osmotically inducible protein OsmC